MLNRYNDDNDDALIIMMMTTMMMEATMTARMRMTNLRVKVGDDDEDVTSNSDAKNDDFR